jgi:hypothetical protein
MMAKNQEKEARIKNREETSQNSEELVHFYGV